MTKYFVTVPAPIAGDTVIATADNGRVYSESNKLHIETTERHYVYKHNANPVGWYMINPETSEAHYLGEGASPTAEFVNLEISDAELWATIEQVEPKKENFTNDVADDVPPDGSEV